MTVETFVPNASVISLTDSARKHFEKKVADRDGQWIRFSTRVSGCTGYAYVLDFADRPEDSDEIVKVSDKLSVAIAKDAVPLVRNTEIDYVKEGVNGIIKYNNPNVVDECGCGESFNISA
ncbi:iron-sulfur cluster assembly accessory protein [Alteromonas pelagimontana]|uniref:Iron-sulfur cluster assembly accessory protein n=1 Tax=Alteromonas pelagimontana TaxID=1858656 RepID=A0A6M4MFU1_9ALTE|nr:iron-sulfur cluster assembly accessory protein [Alteromonas pelagimontana]QJR82034.1 iron-sulfur cluster assembly accessory protein [Alteromonas pelagimontana]